MTETAQAELEEAVRERNTAEAQLARIVTHCRQRLDMAIVQGPVSDLCREILAIIEPASPRDIGRQRAAELFANAADENWLGI